MSKEMLTQETRWLFQEQNPHWWFINLLAGEYEKLQALGRERNENGKTLGWKSKTSDTSDKWNVSGIAGEWAVSLVINKPVGCITSKNASWLNAVGDVGPCEVRTSTGNTLAGWDLGSFGHAIKPDRPYVHAISCLLPEWMILTGWSWGHEIAASKKARKAAHHTDSIYWLEQRELRNIKTLFDEIKVYNTPSLI